MSKYQPTEDEIKAVLAKAGHDARKLAIAYLRATHRKGGADKLADMILGKK